MAPLPVPMGCCPVCDRPVPRMLAPLGARTREVYACPEHGAIGYGAVPTPVARWVDQIFWSESRVPHAVG